MQPFLFLGFLQAVQSLVLITAIPMMIVKPYRVNYIWLSQEETGAWLGGSIDTTVLLLLQSLSYVKPH